LYISSPFAALSAGVLLVYVLGSYLHWHIVAGVLATLPLTSFTCLFFVPESPVWLAKKGLAEEAQQALMWLRGDKKQVGLSLIITEHYPLFPSFVCQCPVGDRGMVMNGVGVISVYVVFTLSETVPTGLL
jgi:hypothetical protein